MKDEDPHLRAVKELHFSLFGNNPNNFTSLLYFMFQKGDSHNKRRLARAFPFEYVAYEEWYNAESEDEFFERYGLQSFRMLYSQATHQPTVQKADEKTD